MKKKVLFVINTMSRAGAEMALLALLRQLDPQKLDISLFVLMGQGEMVPELRSAPMGPLSNSTFWQNWAP